MGNSASGLVQLHSMDQNTQIGIWAGWIGSNNLDRGEFAIYEQLGVPRGKMMANSVVRLTHNEIQFMHAASGRNIAAIRWYISQGVSANTLDENRTSALHIAWRDGSNAIVEELLQHGANVNMVDVGGWIPLHVASHWKRPKICQILLQRGADAFAKTNQHQTPYDLARNDETQYIFSLYWKEREADCNPKIPIDNFIARQEAFARARHYVDSTMQKVPQILDPDLTPVHLSPGRPQSPLVSGNRAKTPPQEEVFWITPLIERPNMVITERSRISDEELGVSIFNLAPFKGISYFICTGVLDNDPADIAEFLWQISDLSPYGIGEVIGWSENGYDQVGKQYISHVLFEQDSIVDALQILLSRVALPSKDTVLKNILGLFAETYCYTHNDYSKKAIQTLIESIILLDNGLHNTVGSPISQSNFMRNLAGANDTQNFSLDLLTSIYKRIAQMSIRTRHTKPPDADLRSMGTPSGVLERIGRRCRWKPAFYVHWGHILWQFVSDTDTTPSKFIPLDSLGMVRKDEDVFGLRPRNDQKNVVTVTVASNGDIRIKQEPEVMFRSHEIYKWCKSF